MKMFKNLIKIFDNLVKLIPKNLEHLEDVILLQYINVFEGQFGYVLRDKSLTTLSQTREYVTNIEENF